MLIKIIMAVTLIGLTVTVHASGISLLLRAMFRLRALAKTGFRPVTRLVICMTCWLILVHLVEISLWGFFYYWQGCLSDLESAFYFSGVTYTTVGYGDIVLPSTWRIFSMLEALTGILMCGLSTGLFFAIVSKWIGNWIERRNALEPGSIPPLQTNL